MSMKRTYWAAVEWPVRFVMPVGLAYGWAVSPHMAPHSYAANKITVGAGATTVVITNPLGGSGGTSIRLYRVHVFLGDTNLLNLQLEFSNGAVIMGWAQTPNLPVIQTLDFAPFGLPCSVAGTDVQFHNLGVNPTNVGYNILWGQEPIAGQFE